MRSVYVAGTQRRRDDEEITISLSKGGIGDGAFPKRIGVRNEQGVIYRSIEARGTSQLIEVLHALYGLKFRDELEQSNSPKDGYDAVFSK